MNCPELQTFEDYLSGELTDPQRCELEAHLQGCQSCRRVLAREQKFDALLRNQPLLKAPAGFRERLLAALDVRDSSRAYPEWLWALGLGLVIATVGLLAGKLGSRPLGRILHEITALVSQSNFGKTAESLQSLPGANLLPQFPGGNSILLINFLIGGVILCWGLWQMVKALRR